MGRRKYMSDGNSWKIYPDETDFEDLCFFVLATGLEYETEKPDWSSADYRKGFVEDFPEYQNLTYHDLINLPKKVKAEIFGWFSDNWYEDWEYVEDEPSEEQLQWELGRYRCGLLPITEY